MQKQIFKFVIIILLFFIADCYSQNVIRKGFAGIRAVDLNDSIANSKSLPNKDGILITEILPKSTAESLKLLAEDILVKVNDIKIKKIQDYRKSVAKIKEGESISIEFIRNGEKNNVEGKVMPVPYETSLTQEIIYDEVKFKDGYIRVIINKPKGQGKFKSIFFIQGYTCFSLDNLGKHPYGQLFNGLCEKGYVVMRVEKPGMGDNTNTPDCDLIDYNTELEAFSVAYKKLKTYDFVDKDNLYIFGHSLGGYEAPMVAEKLGAKGVIVCGTGLKTWYEYIIEMFRFQNIIDGQDYVENELLIQKMIPILYQFLIEKKTPKQIADLDTTYASILKEYLEFNGGDQVWSRHYKYWQQLQDINMALVWKNVNSEVLVIRGEGDFEAFSNSDHQSIVDIVNTYHPGKGIFLLIPNMDHGFAKSKTPAESRKNSQIKGYYYDNFNTVILDEVDNWIKKVSEK